VKTEPDLPGGGICAAGDAVAEQVGLAPASQDEDLGVGGVLGDQGSDSGRHLATVAPDVLHEPPVDAVVDAGEVVLPAAILPTALSDAPQTGERGQVEEDDGVGSLSRRIDKVEA